MIYNMSETGGRDVAHETSMNATKNRPPIDCSVLAAMARTPVNTSSADRALDFMDVEHRNEQTKNLWSLIASTKTHNPEDEYSSAPPSSASPSAGAIETTGADCEQLLRQILANQSAILANQDRILGILEGNVMQPEPQMESLVGSVLVSPLDTEDELIIFNNELNDENLMRKVLKVLYSLGGKTVQETVALVMARLGSNHLWSQFSLKGQKGKKRLSDFGNICTLFSLTCFDRFPRTDQKAINLALQNKLKAAPDKRGGSRCKMTESSNAEVVTAEGLNVTHKSE